MFNKIINIKHNSLSVIHALNALTLRSKRIFLYFVINKMYFLFSTKFQTVFKLCDQENHYYTNLNAVIEVWL